MLTVTFMVGESHFCIVVSVALLFLLVKLFKKQATLSEYLRYKGVPFERVSAFVPSFQRAEYSAEHQHTQHKTSVLVCSAR